MSMNINHREEFIKETEKLKKITQTLVKMSDEVNMSGAVNFFEIIEDTKILKLSGCKSKLINDLDDHQISIFWFEADEDIGIDIHHHNVDEYVIHVSGHFELDEKPQNPGDCVFVPATQKHKAFFSKGSIAIIIFVPAIGLVRKKE